MLNHLLEQELYTRCVKRNCAGVLVNTQGTAIVSIHIRVCSFCVWWQLLESSIYVSVISSDAEWDFSDPDVLCVGGFSTGLTVRSQQLNDSQRVQGDKCSTTERVML